MKIIPSALENGKGEKSEGSLGKGKRKSPRRKVFSNLGEGGQIRGKKMEPVMIRGMISIRRVGNRTQYF